MGSFHLRRFYLPRYRNTRFLLFAACMVLLLSTLSLVTADPLVTAPGELDTSFGTGGYLQIAIPSGYTGITFLDVIQDAQGRIVTGGYLYFSYPDPEFPTWSEDSVIQRYLPDGSLDVSFGNQGSVIAPDAEIHALAIDSTGRMVFASVPWMPPSSGRTERNNPRGVSYSISRLTPDGMPDTTFGTNGLTNVPLSDEIFDLTVDTTGKITVTGVGAGANYSSDLMIQLNDDGSMDTSFGDGGIVALINIRPGQLLYTEDHKLLFNGLMLVDDMWRRVLMRYNPDGSVDNSFGTNGISDSPFYGTGGINLLPDGKILVAGTTASDDPANLSNRVALARFNSDGTLDTTFASDGMAAWSISYHVDISDLQTDPDGNILVAGQSNGRAMLMRFTSDAIPDEQFGYQGRVLSTTNLYPPSLWRVLVLPSGTLLTIGDHEGTGYLSSGTPGTELITNGNFELPDGLEKQTGVWIKKGSAIKKLKRICDTNDQMRGWIDHCVFRFKPGGINSITQVLHRGLDQVGGTLRLSVWISSPISSAGKPHAVIKAKVHFADGTSATLKLPVPEQIGYSFIYLQTQLDLTGKPPLTVDRVQIKARHTPVFFAIDAVSLKYFPAEAAQNPMQLPLPEAPMASALTTR